MQRPRIIRVGEKLHKGLDPRVSFEGFRIPLAAAPLGLEAYIHPDPNPKPETSERLDPEDYEVAVVVQLDVGHMNRILPVPRPKVTAISTLGLLYRSPKRTPLW